jgi:molecular chaperone GrpE
MTDTNHGRTFPEREPSPSERTETDAAEVVDVDAIDQESPEALRAALDEQSARYVRLAADFENFRRRKSQELSERSRYASEDAVRALLPVLDNLRRAVEHMPDGLDEGFAGGLTMTVRQFEEALERLGVRPIETVGTRFDPAIHEAVLGEESPDVDTDTVVDELQRGYRLHDRVVRPAMVKVAHPAHGATASVQ